MYTTSQEHSCLGAKQVRLTTCRKSATTSSTLTYQYGTRNIAFNILIKGQKNANFYTIIIYRLAYWILNKVKEIFVI